MVAETVSTQHAARDSQMSATACSLTHTLLTYMKEQIISEHITAKYIANVYAILQEMGKSLSIHQQSSNSPVVTTGCLSWFMPHHFVAEYIQHK